MSHSLSNNYVTPFRLLHSNDNLSLSVGLPPSSDWQPIANRRLLIIVGVTGVGKSTTVDAMTASGVDFVLLPNRRTLTDDLLIAQMQEADGDVVAIERDRRKRFEYTRRYRQLHVGGMAHALSQLSIKSDLPERLLLFDGLRGVNEIAFAREFLPKARFLVLTAPDLERLRRLCGRNDAFDHVAGTGVAENFASDAGPQGGTSNAILVGAGLDAAIGLFSPHERELLAEMVATNAIPLELLRGKLAIVAEERRSYDPAATVDALRSTAKDRAQIVDTTAQTPEQVADAVAERLSTWWTASA